MRLNKEQTLNKCYKKCAAATDDDGGGDNSDGSGDNGDGGGDSGPQGRTGTFPRPQR